MEHIWAPWRMAYINREDAKDKGCFLCVDPQGQDDEKTLILARGERCFVILNRFPYNPGHLMIAPFAHLPTIEELDTATLGEMMALAQKCLAALRAAMNPDGYNMGINQGHVAGAGVADHVHLHMVPRWNGDTNFMPVLADVKVIPEMLENTYSKVREQLLPLMKPGGRKARRKA
jgi:ATP adenylyltransferase